MHRMQHDASTTGRDMRQDSGLGNIEPIRKHQRHSGALAAHPAQAAAQTAVPDNRDLRNTELHHADLGLALYQKRLALSLSPLMGCDYIFIEAKNCPEFFTAQRLRQTLHELHDLLELSPRQTSFIHVTVQDNKPHFLRYDLQLDEQSILAVTPSHIDHPGQLDYINMLWNCSSSY